MKLKNPFSVETRSLYAFRYNCDKCGSNHALALHHIVGRKSSSPLNASLVCHACHAGFNHTREEEQYLFNKNVIFLKNTGYQPTEKDFDFLRAHSWLIKSNIDFEKWLNS